jgi:hypothetical protein
MMRKGLLGRCTLNRTDHTLSLSVQVVVGKGVRGAGEVKDLKQLSGEEGKGRAGSTPSRGACRGLLPRERPSAAASHQAGWAGRDATARPACPPALLCSALLPEPPPLSGAPAAVRPCPSGGERSFTTVCFTLAMGDQTEMPFRCAHAAPPQ